MDFKTNANLEELEKKIYKLYFVISLIVSVLVLLLGLWYLVTYKEDVNENKLIPIIVIVLVQMVP